MTSFKKIQVRWFCAMAAFVLLVFFPLLALAAVSDDELDITVTLGQIYAIEYTGGPVVQFVIECGDLEEGSMSIIDDGDINWWAGNYPWKITIERTLWDTDDGDQYLEFWLRVKSGPPDNGDWTTVPVYTDPSAPADWIFSEDLGLQDGSGTIEGIDWKIKELNWQMQPGFYWCTVTMTIEPDD